LNGALPTAFIPIPEATVYENNDAVPRKNDVRGAALKILPVEAKSQSHGVQNRADCHFRGDVLSTDCRHVAGSEPAEWLLFSHY